MSNTMEYKGYLGSVEFSETDGVFFGKVLGIRSLLSYEGTTAKELAEDFHGAVDDYLSFVLHRAFSRKKPIRAVSTSASRRSFTGRLLSMLKRIISPSTVW